MKTKEISMLRLFIGILLPDTVKESLNTYLLPYKKQFLNEHIRWVENNNIHITVYFLGTIPVTKLEEIKNALKEVAKTTDPYSIQLEKVDFGPSRTHPKMIWCHFSKNSDFSQFVEKIRVALGNFVTSHDVREAIPHATLARFKEIPKCKDHFTSLYLPPLQIDHFELFSSTLTAQGAIYTSIESFSHA